MQPLGLCATADKTILRFAHHGCVQRHEQARQCSTSARRRDTSRWSRDLSDVLLEPEAQVTPFRNPLAHTRREALEEWQLQKIQAASEINKHKVKVEDLVEELNLPRGVVLKHIKTFRTDKLEKLNRKESQGTTSFDPDDDILQPSYSGTQVQQPQARQKPSASQMSALKTQATQPSTKVTDRSQTLHASPTASLQAAAGSVPVQTDDAQQLQGHPLSQAAAEQQDAKDAPQPTDAAQDFESQPQYEAPTNMIFKNKQIRRIGRSPIPQTPLMRSESASQSSTIDAAAERLPEQSSTPQQTMPQHAAEFASSKPQSLVLQSTTSSMPQAAPQVQAAGTKPQFTAQQQMASALPQAEPRQTAAQSTLQATAEVSAAQAMPQSPMQQQPAAEIPRSSADLPASTALPRSKAQKPAALAALVSKQAAVDQKLHSTANQQANSPQLRPPQKRSDADFAPQSPAKQQRAASKPRGKKVKPVSFAERQRQGTDFDKKRLGKAVEATLEKMYQQSKFPSDENINSFLQLHRGLPRYRVVDWFGERRRMSRQ